jgi:tRNA (cmo5U34)-methyltransferase
VGQFHDAPSEYLALVREALPAYDRLQDEVARATAGGPVRRILDLGIGTGETARRVLALHPEAGVVAVDASGEMLKLARVALGERVETHLGRIQDPLPAGPFDLVVSALAVHHLDGAGKTDLFGRIARVLRPGGRFVMGDVVVPEAPVARPAPLEEGVDLPDRVDDMVVWLAAGGLEPEVCWAEEDLAVVAARRPG